MTRPTKYPRWASTLVKNETNKEYNIYEPPEQKKDLGWDLNEVPPRQWLNWLNRFTHDWIVFFDTTKNGVSYLTAELPPAAENVGRILLVSDIGTGTLVFSDGTNWKKLTISGNV